MDEQLKNKLKRLIDYKGLPYRLRAELEKGEITQELLDECTFYLDDRKLFALLQEIQFSLPDKYTYRKEDKSPPKPRFPKNKWHEKINRNFTLALDERIKEHGDIAELARIVSSQVGMSQRQIERYLNGETKLTAEALLMFEEVLHIHRDEILGELPLSEKGPKTADDIKEFRVLFNLIKGKEMISDDVKDILKELFKLYNEINRIYKGRFLYSYFKSIDITEVVLTKKLKQLKINILEIVRDEILDTIEEIKRETTT